MIQTSRRIVVAAANSSFTTAGAAARYSRTAIRRKCRIRSLDSNVTVQTRNTLRSIPFCHNDCCYNEKPSLSPFSSFSSPLLSSRSYFSTSSTINVDHDHSNDADDYYYYDDTDDTDDHDDTDVHSHLPWKDLIERPARASWRSSSLLYDYNSSKNDNDSRNDDHPLLMAQHLVLTNGDRTDRQLARAHRKVVELQSELSQWREQERRKIVNNAGTSKRRRRRTAGRSDYGSTNGKTYPKGFVPADDHDYDDDDNNTMIDDGGGVLDDKKTPQPIIYGYDETLSTLKHRLIPNFAITQRVLKECQSLLFRRRGVNGNSSSDGKPFQPRRILDFGIGCGSASAAAIDVFHKLPQSYNSSSSASASSSSIQWIHGIDPSHSMRQCSKLVLEDYIERLHNLRRQEDQMNNDDNQQYTHHLHHQRPRITVGSELSLDQRQRGGGNSSTKSTPASPSSSSSSEGKFDLILSCYTGSDMPDVFCMVSAAALLFSEKLAPDGVLVFIEPGTPDGFSTLRSIRNMLIDCCRPDESTEIDNNDDPDDHNNYEFECQIIAPCTHHGTCPMERHKWNFEAPKGKLAYDIPQQQQVDEQKRTENDTTSTMTTIDDESNLVDSYPDDLNMASETNAFDTSFCSFVHNINNVGGNAGGRGGRTRGADRGEKFTYLVVQKKRRRDIEDVSTEQSNDIDDHDKISQWNNVPKLLHRAFEASAKEDDEMATDIFRKAQKLRSKYIGTHQDGERDGNIDHPDHSYDELGLQHVGETLEDWGRVIRAPIKKKGHVYVDYCSSPGKIIRSRITKSISNNIAPGMYPAARKARWGGLFPRLPVASKNESNEK